MDHLLAHAFIIPFQIPGIYEYTLEYTGYFEYTLEYTDPFPNVPMVVPTVLHKLRCSMPECGAPSLWTVRPSVSCLEMANG